MSLFDDPIIPGKPYIRGQNRVEWLRVNDAAYRKAIEQAEAAEEKVRPKVCQHRGEPTGEKVECPSCNGKVQLKLLACAVHGKCTVGKKIEGIAYCHGCPDYLA